ncbi:hypothetical protein [Tomitella fengzijianii]|uniref:hypothetical protein n=1 Tax=Tomitella fengzijianii TaxID=2597660 RepID=UPI00131B8CCC|nr:hypothetical protein [Tomitella fengzijianii]
MGSLPGLIDLLPLIGIMDGFDTMSLNGIGSAQTQSLDAVGSLEGLLGGGA